MLARHVRPVFALALARAPMPEWRGELLTRVMMSWLLTCAVPLLGLAAALVTMPAEDLVAAAPRLPPRGGRGARPPPPRRARRRRRGAGRRRHARGRR